MNPRAGLRASRFLAAVRDARWGGDLVDVRLTERPRHASELAAEAVAEGCTRVLSVGGDGTLNEIATALCGTGVALGIVPGGSGNGLARGLGIPMAPQEALNALETASVYSADVLRANGRAVFNVAGVGFDAEVTAAFQAATAGGGRRGILPYVVQALRLALGYRPGHWRVVVDGSMVFDGPALLVAVANGPQYGAGAIIAPAAKLDDGAADVALVEPAPLWELAWNALRLFRGRLPGYRRYRGWQGRTVSLESEGSFPSHRDGEVDGANRRLEVTVEPGSLRLLVPSGDGPPPAFLGRPLAPGP